MKNIYALSPKKLPATQLKQTALPFKSLLSAIAIILLAILQPVKLFAQAPAVSYTSPSTYVVGATIPALAPASNNVAPLGFVTQVVASGLNNPGDVAFDAAGNMYVSEEVSGDIKEFPIGGGAPLFLGSGLHSPRSIALDAAGNLYVTDGGNKKVKKIPVGGGPTVTLGHLFVNIPLAVAVDAAGNVYVGNDESTIVRKIPVGGGAVIALAGGFNTPAGLAVDAADNVYVCDGNNQIKEIPVGGGRVITLGSGFNSPQGIALDAAGNVYVACLGDGTIKEMPAGGGAPVTLASGFTYPIGVAVDAAGHVYEADGVDGVVKEITKTGGYYITPGLPAGLSFDNNTGTISGTPTVASPLKTYTITAYNASGSTSATVNIAVAAPSKISTLSNLTISGGVLAPAFAGGTVNYTASFVYGAQAVMVTPTLTDPLASVTVNGTPVLPGAASAAISLVTGKNQITTIVTASDGVTTKTYSMVINLAKAPLTVTANNEASVQGFPLPALSYSYSGFVNGDTTTNLSTVPVISTTARPSSAPGNYPITVRGGVSGNYTFTYVPGTLTVSAPTLAFAPIASQTYGAADFDPGAVTNAPITYNSSNTAVATIVSGNIHIVGAGLTTITATVKASPKVLQQAQQLTVNQAALNITADAQTQVYGSPVPALTVSYAGFVNGDTPLVITAPTIVTTAGTAPAAGTYPIMVSGPASNGNYSVTYTNGSLTVTPAPLTLTADNQSRPVNTRNPKLTVTYTGLVNGDIPADLTTPPMITTPARISAAVGTYPIRIGGAASPNYLFTYVPGTFTITAAPGTLPASETGSFAITAAPGDMQAPKVNTALSPNGDGKNDVLMIANIEKYPDNTLMIMDGKGAKVFEIPGYDNQDKVFKGHSNISGKMVLAGTYFYKLQYRYNGVMTSKTGYFVLSY